MRPWLIVRINEMNHFDTFPIASQAYGSPHFYIDSTHPDFVATGLKKSCCILDMHFYELRPDIIHKQRGRLTGELLAAFQEYAGL